MEGRALAHALVRVSEVPAGHGRVRVLHVPRHVQCPRRSGRWWKSRSAFSRRHGIYFLGREQRIARNNVTDRSCQNLTLYSVFAGVGFFSGSIVNWVGIRLSLSFGGIGYCIYAISLLVSVHKYVPGFNIFAGALLGACAGILWSAQGAIMMSYPHEHQKGRYFAWFWGIFNIGACMGSLVRMATANREFVSSNRRFVDRSRHEHQRQSRCHCCRRNVYRLHRPDVLWRLSGSYAL